MKPKRPEIFRAFWLCSYAGEANTCAGQACWRRVWKAQRQLISIALTGHSSLASVADCSASGGISPIACALPLSVIWNTSGQRLSHSPQPIQVSWTTAFMKSPPFNGIGWICLTSACAFFSVLFHILQSKNRLWMESVIVLKQLCLDRTCPSVKIAIAGAF